MPSNRPQPIVVTPAMQTPDVVEKAKQCAVKWQLPYVDCANQGLVLLQHAEYLALKQLDDPKLGEIQVDFASDALTFRRQRGGGKKEAIAKAVGCKGQHVPHVIDATAGLGRDAFVLASLGCKVDLIERSPVVAALLNDGLIRAKAQPVLAELLTMRLCHGPSYDVLAGWRDENPMWCIWIRCFRTKTNRRWLKKKCACFSRC